MKNLITITSTLSLMLSFQAYSEVHQSGDLATFLKEFHTDPAKVINQLPPKSQSASLFSNEVTKSKDFVTLKSQQKDQQNFCQNINGVKKCLNNKSPEGKVSFLGNDKAEYLVDSNFEHLKNLNHIDKTIMNEKGDLEGSLDNQPWSDDYWAIAKGILGFRYADDETKGVRGWKKAKDKHLTQLPASAYVESGRVNSLSPSEKYDLLIGDENYTLTQAMWSEGERYWSPTKEVEAWMGICHGWAPAAYMLPRPTNAVNVIAADGKTEITFYPSDIKALASLLWSKESTETKFIGGRCNVKDPKEDGSGRVQDNDCFDSNPGTWHKVIVNQIKKGPEGRSFVMDATYDYEVWNQPVYAYEYRYFNPMTGYESNNWSDEKVRLSVDEYSNDKFKKYRSKSAKFIVGVEMNVDYIAETRPTQRTNDSSEYDRVNSVTYRYDLEVAFDGEIVGGEWYTNAHPDFMWTPEKDSRAATDVDKMIKNLKITASGTPKEFKKVALYVSGHSKGPSYQGSPLAKVVEELIRLSNEQE